MTPDELKELEDKLTDKQRRFCIEYLTDFNGAQSAIRAGYSKDTARSIASELLTKPDIQSYLSYHKDQHAAKLGLTAEMVLKEWMQIGFSRITDYLDAGNVIKDLTTVSDDKIGAVSSISVTEVVGDFGTSTKTSFRMHAKQSALDRMAEYLGIIKKDDAFGDGNTVIIVRRPSRPDGANGGDQGEA